MTFSRGEEEEEADALAAAAAAASPPLPPPVVALTMEPPAPDGASLLGLVSVAESRCEGDEEVA